MRTEIKRCGLREQASNGNVAALGARCNFLVRMDCVVKQRTRLNEHRKHVISRVIAKCHRAFAKVRQERVSALKAQAAIKLLEQVAQGGIRQCRLLDLLARRHKHARAA